MSERAKPSAMRRVLGVFSETERLEPKGAVAAVVMTLSVLGCVTITWLALFGKVTEHEQIAWFLTFLFPVCFLTTSFYTGFARRTAADYLLVLVAFALGVWFVTNEPRYQVWMPSFSEITLWDQIAGMALVVVLVLGRIGWVLARGGESGAPSAPAAEGAAH